MSAASELAQQSAAPRRSAGFALAVGTTIVWGGQWAAGRAALAPAPPALRRRHPSGGNSAGNPAPTIRPIHRRELCPPQCTVGAAELPTTEGAAEWFLTH